MKKSELKQIIKEEIHKIQTGNSISKKDIDVYRMSLYPDKKGKRGVEEMIDNIGNKIKNFKANNISYEAKSNGDLMVEFTIDKKNYQAKFNHTGTCEFLKIK